jgi:hypothetical protein
MDEMKFKENWYSLLICITKEKKISIDKSIVKMGLLDCIPSGKQENPRPSKYSSEIVNLALDLRQQGKSYKEIGSLIGLNRNQAYGLVRVYGNKKATRTPTKVVQAAY